jgi:GNAT superfamily N-acetyltransferase
MSVIQLSELYFKELHFPTADEEDMIKYYEFRMKLNKERDPDETELPMDVWMKFARDDDPKRKNYNIAVFRTEGDKTKVIAQTGFGYVTPKAPNYETDKHIVGISLSVLKQYRGNGIGPELLKRCLTEVKKLPDVTKIFGSAYLEEGIKFMEKSGGKKDQVGSENRLRMDDVDWDLINSWNQKGIELGEKEEVTTQFFEDCPDEILEEYCSIYSETMNQQPLGDYDGEIKETPETRRESERKNREKSLAWYTFITREKDGKISGLTEIFYHPGTSHKGYQNLTGVKEEYRGRGLGKWLKAKMLLWYYDKYPQIKYITTGNADSNAPMMSINNRMGYKTFKSGTSYTFVAQELYKRFDL